MDFFKKGICVDDGDLERLATILNCKVVGMPFLYLAILIRRNLRRFSTLDPVLEKFKSKLATWKQNTLFIRGRVTLINSVLSSLPLFSLFFFKASFCVTNKIISIRRNFLWGGSVEARKVSWVKWDDAYLPKAQGRLGIKNVESFNKVLLGKWRWRLSQGPSSLW